jgi:hypothetical protein
MKANFWRRSRHSVCQDEFKFDNSDQETSGDVIDVQLPSAAINPARPQAHGMQPTQPHYANISQKQRKNTEATDSLHFLIREMRWMRSTTWI